MPHYFQIVDIEDERIRDCLNSIILFANPLEKNTAHITIRGPYNSYERASQAICNIRGTQISVCGVGAFFDEKQNTIYLRCGSEQLAKVWWKPDFEFCPHITVYDGDSRSFAQKLLQVFGEYSLYFSVCAGNTHVISSQRGQKKFDLWLNVNAKSVQEISGQDVDIALVSSLPEWQRLMIIDRLCTRLKWLVQNIRSRDFANCLFE